MAKQLTNLVISKVKATDQRQDIADTAVKGLVLIVQPKTGTRSFIFRFKRKADRKAVKITLGKWTEQEVGEPVIGGLLTLAGARFLASRLQHERAQGKEPEASKRNQDDEGRDYASLARLFIEKHAKPNTRLWIACASRLGFDRHGHIKKNGLANRWGALSIDDITEDMLFHELDKSSSPSVERALYSALSSMFSFLKAKRIIKTNPMSGLKRPSPGPSRERTLTDKEIREFWKACDGLNPAFGSAFKVLLLTGARLREIAHARVSELSDDGCCLKLPGTRTKNHRAHDIFLVPLARKLIERRRRDDCDFIFTTNGRSPISGFAKAKLDLDKLMQADDPKTPLVPFTIHDLRRTFITNCARANLPLHVIEKAVNHQSGMTAGVAGVYQRFKFVEEIKQAMEAHAALLDQILLDKTAKIIPMKKRASK